MQEFCEAMLDITLLGHPMVRAGDRYGRSETISQQDAAEAVAEWGSALKRGWRFRDAKGRYQHRKYIEEESRYCWWHRESHLGRQWLVSPYCRVRWAPEWVVGESECRA